MIKWFYGRKNSLKEYGKFLSKKIENSGEKSKGNVFLTLLSFPRVEIFNKENITIYIYNDSSWYFAIISWYSTIISWYVTLTSWYLTVTSLH